MAHKKTFRHHVRNGEMLYIVPKLLVHEPIAWNDIPLVVERAKIEFEKWLGTRPNLTEGDHNTVKLYWLRKSRHIDSHGSVNLADIVET